MARRTGPLVLLVKEWTVRLDGRNAIMYITTPEAWQNIVEDVNGILRDLHCAEHWTKNLGIAFENVLQGVGQKDQRKV